MSAMSSQPLKSVPEVSLMAKNRRNKWTKRTNQGKVKGKVIPIDVLPDDVLLAIFEFCMFQGSIQDSISTIMEIEAWQKLVHICRRWRSVVFGSPRRLNLRLGCTAKTPADTLDVWPALPLCIEDRRNREEGIDNIISVLERSDRVHVIDLWPGYVSSSNLAKLSAAMQVPFPELTDLRLCSDGGVVLPDSFLGGSAPRLRFLSLFRIPFPGLSKLLSTATHLDRLYLYGIPHSGYISPEAMLAALSVLTRLDRLILEFQSPLSRPDRATRRCPRSVLSILTSFEFKGDSEYLDYLLAHIDAPRLCNLYITFFNQVVFNTPQLIQFICHTPRLKPLEKACVTFDGSAATVNLSSRTPGDNLLRVKISCRKMDWQVSSVVQVCTSSLPPLSTLVDLYINEDLSWPADYQDNIENALFLELLHPFRAVENLYLSTKFAPRIVPALKELVGSRAKEVLPNLQNIFLEGLNPSGPVLECVLQFVATREVTGDPIAVSPWDGRWY